MTAEIRHVVRLPSEPLSHAQLVLALSEAIKLLRASGMGSTVLIESLKAKLVQIGWTQTDIVWVDLQ